MLHDFVEDPLHTDNVAVLVYHTYSDPWVTLCGPEHTARYTYYNVTGIPSVRFDGIEGNYLLNESDLTTPYAARIDVDSPIEIDMYAYVTGTGIEAFAEINSGDEAISGNYKIRFALVNLLYDEFTGTNGQTEWHWDMLDMAPDTDGLDFTIDANSTASYQTTLNWPVSLQGTPVELDNVKVIAFVQDDDTHEILQAEWVLVFNEYMLIADAERTSIICATDDETFASFSIQNVGANDDTYDIEVNAASFPAFSWIYTNQNGTPIATNSSVSVASGETFNSNIEVLTADNYGVGGSLIFTITSQNYPDLTRDIEFFIQNDSQVLVVNADPDQNNFEYYDEVLEYWDEMSGNALCYSQWFGNIDQFINVELDEDVWTDLIIFYAGSGENIMSQELQDKLVYLTGELSRNVIITGSHIPIELNNTELFEALGARAPMAYPSGTSVTGVAGDPIGDGLEFDIVGGSGANNTGTPTAMLPYNGTQCLMYNGSQRAGISFDPGAYRSIVLGFPFEAIADYDSRLMLMHNMLVYTIDYTSIGVRDLPAENIPQEFSLNQNYPNPFNPVTEISFDLPETADVHLSVYNMLGQEIAVLADDKMDAGRYAVSWNAANFASGVYFYKLHATSDKQSFNKEGKMVLVK